jgi:hypothetical protein
MEGWVEGRVEQKAIFYSRGGAFVIGDNVFFSLFVNNVFFWTQPRNEIGSGQSSLRKKKNKWQLFFIYLHVTLELVCVKYNVSDICQA